jgi:polyisoprenoid-binding protein YceI
MKKSIFVTAITIASTAGTVSIAKAEGSKKSTDSKSEAVSYVVSEMDASIVWSGSKITGSSHTGTMELAENLLEFKGKDLAGGSFVMDMNSMKNTDLSGGSADKLIGHLKSDDFFGVASYPTSEFKITEVKPGTNAGEYHVTGDLTIKSTTLPITFPVNISWEGNRAIASAQIVVNRADYDVRFGSGRFFDNLGNNAIKDEFTLDVKIVSEVNAMP